jgi:hypothetical protein
MAFGYANRVYVVACLIVPFYLLEKYREHTEGKTQMF